MNYDLPWNPTRIMQRVGRINRVGTEFDRIYVFNFFPTAQSAKHMPLEDRILEKLQAFHDTLGEDIKYLSDDEEVSPQKLFSDLNKDIDCEDEESTNPELAYLALIRKIRDNDAKLFSQIKRLPQKAKSAKSDKTSEDDSTVTFIRKGSLKSFFKTDDKGTEQMTFMEAIKLIEAEPDTPKVSVVGKYYDHLKDNSSAFDNMLIEDEEITIEKPMVAGNDAKIIKTLKAIIATDQLTDNQENVLGTLIRRWENGDIPAKVSKDVVKATNLASDILALYYDIVRIVPEAYLEEKKEKKSIVEGKKEIILSCYLKGGK